MENILNKKYKIKQLQKIKKKYKYIYIFRYNNISIKNFFFLKKKFKNNILILKKNILNQKFLNIKLYGCLFIIYNNNYINIKNFFFLKNLEFLFFFFKKNLYSNLKLKIYIKINKNLYINLINLFLFFLILLKKISVNIT